MTITLLFLGLAALGAGCFICLVLGEPPDDPATVFRQEFDEFDRPIH